MEGALLRAAEALSAAISLGRRSLRPASGILLSVAIVSFVRAGLAEEFFRGPVPLTEAAGPIPGLTSMLLTAVVFSLLSIGFLLLIPLQDSLELGEPANERTAAQVVFRRTGPLAISGLVQAAVVLGPPAVLFVTLTMREVRAVLATGGTLDAETLLTLQAAVLRGSLVACCSWLAVTNALVLFAAPFLLLENRGPLRSIGLSAALFLRRVIPEWPRFLSIAFLWGFLYVAVVLPESEILRALAHLPRWSFLRSVLPATWTAVSTTLALAYGTAGLVVLFRRLVPVGP
ncbi:MAG: hypothetical protein E6K79_10985 [Candidatus Eisenbacteria bacterium]|uniref:Uncharacterized protein n=1 Tax=Eiseniibacteriota bacterium TaxID=2212470 RepID=A0A538THR7_UNCEI|nr:MAG: hypothetical protein E6K79_10985 [Candidatus Eisenbacteria bacterium]